jgi:hypothetical protein
MAFFKNFPLFRHRTSKNSLFFLKGDQNKNVQKEISFYSQGLHQFSPASASMLCRNPVTKREGLINPADSSEAADLTDQDLVLDCPITNHRLY